MLSAEQLELLRRTRLTGPNKLLVAMRLLGLTQVQLAEAMGSTQALISKHVNGNPSLGNARQYASFFGVQIEDLFPARDSERVAS